MIDAKSALLTGLDYLRLHPGELLRALRNARHRRVGIPVAALQWLVRELTSKSSDGARDVEIHPSPPGLRVDATIEQMGTLIRGSCVIVVERVELGACSVRLELRLRNVQVKLVDESVQTPLAALIRSETLDLSRVASLVAYLPSRPSALVEAVEDRLVVDLLKIPRIANDSRLRQVIALAATVLAVETVVTDADHLDVGFRPFPNGLGGMFHM
jgi:hypothetical protein